MKVIKDLRISDSTISFDIEKVSKKKEIEKIEKNGNYFELKYENDVVNWVYKNKEFQDSGKIDLTNTYCISASYFFKECNYPWFKKSKGEWDIQDFPDPKEAKILWKNIQPFVSKPFYDKTLCDWDIQCICGECANNPSFGYLLESNNGTISYKGKSYEKVPFKDWSIETWWTKDEYEEMKKAYAPDPNRFSEPEKVLEKFERDWPSFNEFFTTNGEIIDGVPKVTKHWFNTPNPKLTPCPICKDLYSILKVYRPLSLRIRQFLNNWFLNIGTSFRRKRR